MPRTQTVVATLLLLAALGVGPAASAAQGVPAAPVPAAALPVVYLLATGGTITSRGATSTSLTDYGGSTKPLTGEELVAAVPEITRVARVVVEQVANVPSSDITGRLWLRLAKRIDEIFRADASAAGVVVTHGTDTLEETAYFLNLTVRHDRPVVLVGSMRPATAISADGPLNLLNGVRTAISPDARGKGTLIVLNDEINAARDATKTNTLRVETFRSADLGLLGYADGDRVTFYREPTRRHTARSEFDVTALTELPRVDVVYTHIDVQPDAFRASVEAGAKGIVFAGEGNGSLSSRLRDGVRDVLASRPVDSRPALVRSSRTGTGRVAGGADFDRLGVIGADNLNPQKARILLMLALTKTRDPAEIRRMFAEY